MCRLCFNLPTLLQFKTKQQRQRKINGRNMLPHMGSSDANLTMFFLVHE